MKHFFRYQDLNTSKDSMSEDQQNKRRSKEGSQIKVSMYKV